MLKQLLRGWLLLPLALPAAAQALDPTFAAPTSLYALGDVTAFGPPQADGKRVVSAYYTRLNGTATYGGLFRMDATGALDATFQQNAGSLTNIYRIRGAAGGQYLVGNQGGALALGNVTRNELLRLNADGTADASFNPGPGPNAGSGFGYSNDFVVQPDGKVLVGGYFNNWSGTTVGDVIRLNANGTVDTGFSAGVGIPLASSAGTYQEVDALAVQADGKVLVGGLFNTFNGAAAAGLVRLSANGTRDASFTSPFSSTSYIYALAVQPDGNILVNGALTVGGSSTRTGLVRLLPSGAVDTSFNPSALVSTTIGSAYLEAPFVVQPDGKIIVIGSFSVPGYSHITRLNADGSLDVTFQAPNGPSSYAATVGLQANGNIQVGGNFEVFNNTEVTLGQLTSSGAVDAGFTSPKLQVAGNTTAMARQADGAVLVGGNFTEWNGQAVHHLVRLSSTGALDAAYNAATGPLPGAVNTLLVQADGQAVAGLAYMGARRFQPNGSPDAGFSFFAPTANVTALAQQPDGKLLAAGNIQSISGDVARLTTAGAVDNTFAPAATPNLGTLISVDAVLVQADGRIAVAANYILPAASYYTAYLKRYETSGAADASFSTQSFTYSSNGTSGTSRLYALAQQPDGKLLASGHFTSVGSTAQNGVARFTTAGVLDASFAPGTQLSGTDYVYSLALQPNGRVLLGGTFTLSGAGSSNNYLARLLPTGLRDASFANTAAPSGPVRTVLVQPDGAILLQGSFSAVGGQPRLGIARITAPNVLAVAAPGLASAALLAWPVPAHDQLHVAPDPNARPQRAELLDALGRSVRQLALSSAAEFTVPLAGLPAGPYLLRLTYAEGTVVRRVSVE